MQAIETETDKMYGEHGGQMQINIFVVGNNCLENWF